MPGLQQYPGATGASTLTQPSWLEWRGSGHILVVDDAEAVRTVVFRSVAKLGFTADLASTGPQALALFKLDPAKYALVIADFKLPGMTGVEVLREVRNLRPTIPAVLMSGYSMQDAIDPDGHDPIELLAKPFTLTTLAAAIRGALEFNSGEK